MSSRYKRALWVGLLGFALGILGGAYIGLILGGTYLGGSGIPERTGLGGYEIAAYVGAAFGVAIITPLAIRCALKVD